LTRKPNSLSRTPVRGTVNAYWLDGHYYRPYGRRRKRARQQAGKQASAQAKKPVDLWSPVG